MSMHTKTIMLPLRLVSESNKREHWTKRAERVKRQRLAARVAVFAATTDAYRRQYFAEIVITRIAPRFLDEPVNSGASAKAVQDGIADALGVDDGDRSIKWVVRQERGLPKQYAVRIELHPVAKATGGLEASCL